MARVLVIDDRKDIRSAFLMALDIYGYEASAVEDTIQADKALANTSFDYIVTDLQLPNETGLSFLKRIREGQNNIPAVLFSGSITPEVISELNGLENVQAVGKEQGVLVVIDKMKQALKE